MKLWDTLRKRRAAKREERERQAQEDLVAISLGEAHELSSYKRAIRRDYVGEGFPSAGAGYMPPRAGEGFSVEAERATSEAA
jgi:hypothetical protein